MNEHNYITELKKIHNTENIIGYKQLNEKHNKYIDSMDDKIKLAMSIAIDHLGTSFHLTKSNGYLHYEKSNK